MECKTKTFEQLEDSGAQRFRKLDIKMAQAFAEAYKKEPEAMRLMQEIQILDEDIMSKGGMMKGRLRELDPPALRDGPPHGHDVADRGSLQLALPR